MGDPRNPRDPYHHHPHHYHQQQHHQHPHLKQQVSPSSPSLCDTLIHKHRIYQQMAMLVHELQGATSERCLISDEDDDGNANDRSSSTCSSDIFDVVVTRGSVKASSLKSAMSEAIARGETRLLKRMVTVCDKVPHSGRKQLLSCALAEAIDAKSVDMVNVLMKGNARASGSHMNQSHLARAVRCGKVEVVNLLVKAGADVNAEVENKTVLHIAASTSSATDVIQCLLDNGSHVEANDSIQGNTALHLACSYSNTETVCVLIRYGAEFNAPNCNGDTPLVKLLRHITKNKDDWHNNKSLKLARELIERGLMVFPCDGNLLTASRDRQSSCRRLKRKQNSTDVTLSPSSSVLTWSSPGQPRSHNSSGNNVPGTSTTSKDRSSKILPEKCLLPGGGGGGRGRKGEGEPLKRMAEDSESMDEFFISSSLSSSSSSSLASSSSSSLSSSESTPAYYGVSTHEQILASSSRSSQKSRTCSWWRKKEAKLVRLYEKLVSESRASWTLQQHCRLRVLSCLATRPLHPSVKALGLPRMVQHYILHGHDIHVDVALRCGPEP